MASAARRALTSAAFEFAADELPRSRTALPDLSVSPKASTVTFGVLWAGANGRADDARTELAATRQAAADDARAEDIAATYAAGASSFDYRDLGPWRTALVKGVSPELKTKLESTAGAMNQLLQPLRWVSTGTVLDAVVTSRSGPVSKVNTYVKVVSTNSQSAGTVRSSRSTRSRSTRAATG